MAALDSITGMPKLPVTSAARASFKAAPTGYMGPQEIAPIEEEIGSEIVKAKEKVGQADVDIEKARREEKSRELESKATGLEKFAQEVEQMPERVELKELREKQRGMEFIPTKDTAQDIAGLFSIMSVVGMVIGKRNAQGAMSAMNGMLDGYQKGRQDLFKKEANEFDRNFKAMQTKVTSALAEFQEALKVRQTNKEAGELREQAALAKMESPLLNAIYQKQGSVAVLERLQEMKKSTTETMPKLINDLQKANDDRAAENERARLQRVQAKELAQIKADTAGGGGASLPKDKETNNEHRFRYSAMQNVQDVIDELKKPEVRKLIGPQNQFTPDVLLNLQKGFPELAQKLSRFQSEEFKIGGKSLTSSEQKILGPIYNWRGLTATALEDNLKEAERAMGKEQQYLENRYPGLKQFNYGQGKQYQLGQIIEQKGKKYRVTGLSDPSDPDVEEVQ